MRKSSWDKIKDKRLTKILRSISSIENNLSKVGSEDKCRAEILDRIRQEMKRLWFHCRPLAKDILEEDITVTRLENGGFYPSGYVFCMCSIPPTRMLVVTLTVPLNSGRDQMISNVTYIGLDSVSKIYSLFAKEEELNDSHVDLMNTLNAYIELDKRSKKARFYTRLTT